MSLFTQHEILLMKKMNTPAKIQDFLNGLSFNFEKKGETLKSPMMVLRTKSAHCMEGGLFAAHVLSLHGFTPYILCLKAKKGDFDHIITPFKIDGLWGAISKTNHAVLRYREPLYKNIHELVMSYFHEYFLDDGTKTLRQYSQLFNLQKLKGDWATSEADLWYIDEAIERAGYYDIVPASYIKKLRKADKVEIAAGKIVEYKKPNVR